MSVNDLGHSMRKYKISGILTGVALIALAGCAPSLKKPMRTADIPTPQAWSAVSQNDTQGDYADTDWIASFQSATLQQLVQEALEHNRDIQAAAARVAQARARAGIVGADQWPQIGIGINGSQSTVIFGNQSQTTKNYNIGFNGTWELDLWGRIASAAKGARLDAKAQDYTYAAARLSLAGQVAQAWFGAIIARQQLELARATVSAFNHSEEIVRRRYENGLNAKLDWNLAVSNLQSARALERLREQQFGEQKRQLEVLLGRYPAAAIETEMALPELSGPIGAGVPSDILVRRPDLQAAYERIIAAKYRVAEARRAFLPRITLSGSYGDQAQAIVNAFDFKQLVSSIAARLIQPVVDGKRLRSNLALEKANTEEAAENYAQAALVAFREVEDALAAENQLTAREKALAESASQAASAEKLAEIQYTNGLTDILLLLDSQRRNLDAQNQFLDARLARLNSRVRLYVALGGSLRPSTPPVQG